MMNKINLTPAAMIKHGGERPVLIQKNLNGNTPRISVLKMSIRTLFSEILHQMMLNKV
jgi:hypothetical protein